MNPYSVLGVAPDADTRTIKAAFRKKIKALHPDTRGGASGERLLEVHRLIEAYEILTDPERRQSFPPPRSSHQSEFNYRDWLLQRDDEDSQAKLIFYDVLRERGDEALERYLRLSKEHTFALEKLLGREDFMDCAFMLALECERQNDVVLALQLFLRIGELEKAKPFFRHFFIEVEDHLLSLLTQKISWQIKPPELIHSIEAALELPIRPRAKASLLGFLANLYRENGEAMAAQESWDRARKINPKDVYVLKLARLWSNRSLSL
jgi:tetratricopeptide (TPR) repeat protein